METDESESQPLTPATPATEPEPPSQPSPPPEAEPPPAAATVLRGRVTEANADLEAKWTAREEAAKRKEMELAEKEDRLSRREEALARASRPKVKPAQDPWWRSGGSSILGD